MTSAIEFAYHNGKGPQGRHSLQHELRCRGLIDITNPGEFAIRVPKIVVWPTYRCVPGLGREGAEVQHIGVIDAEGLKHAEGFLMEGYHVVFKKVSKEQASDRPNLYRTPTAPCLTTPETVMQGPDFEKEYWKLRAAIRYGVLRATKYKVMDTAILADRLLKGENPDEITQEFEKIVLDIADQAVRQNDQESPYRRYNSRGYRGTIRTPLPSPFPARRPIVVNVIGEAQPDRFQAARPMTPAFPHGTERQQQQGNLSERH